MPTVPPKSIRLLKPAMDFDDIESWYNGVDEEVDTHLESKDPVSSWGFFMNAVEKAEKIKNLPTRIAVMVYIVYNVEYRCDTFLPPPATDTTVFSRVLRDAVDGVCKLSSKRLDDMYSEFELEELRNAGNWLAASLCIPDTLKKLGKKLAAKMEKVKKLDETSG